MTENEKRWCFELVQPWLAGLYKLKVDEKLEDNSGNSIGRRFEVDTFNKTEATTQVVTVLEFQVSE
jgi:hypothetical protein